jgi:hypothetical protein
MMSESSSHYEELQGRVRGLLIAVAPQLPAMTVGIVSEMIDANESGLALETLSEMLAESDAVISADTLASISSLVDMMGLDKVNVDRLRNRPEM